MSTGKRLLAALYGAFVTPTAKQLEAYGRFVHNPRGGVCDCRYVNPLTESRYGLLHVFALFAAGVSCFVAGALFSGGE